MTILGVAIEPAEERRLRVFGSSSAKAREPLSAAAQAELVMSARASGTARVFPRPSALGLAWLKTSFDGGTSPSPKAARLRS